jgi:hypothetical protein
MRAACINDCYVAVRNDDLTRLEVRLTLCKQQSAHCVHRVAWICVTYVYNVS